jgi:hypothetical protein
MPFYIFNGFMLIHKLTHTLKIHDDKRITDLEQCPLVTGHKVDNRKMSYELGQWRRQDHLTIQFYHE